MATVTGGRGCGLGAAILSTVALLWKGCAVSTGGGCWDCGLSLGMGWTGCALSHVAGCAWTCSHVAGCGWRGHGFLAASSFSWAGAVTMLRLLLPTGACALAGLSLFLSGRGCVLSEAAVKAWAAARRSWSWYSNLAWRWPRAFRTAWCHYRSASGAWSSAPAEYFFVRHT